MQAVRLCHIAPPTKAGSEAFAFTVQLGWDGSGGMKAVGEEAEPLNETGREEGDEERTKAKQKPKDPLRMFGILTPQSLRAAQGEAVKMVEGIVPKLVSIDAQMKEVEIKIRRARKYRAKAEALEKKDGEKDLGVGIESRKEELII
jgi:hypothetical protein